MQILPAVYFSMKTDKKSIIDNIVRKNSAFDGMKSLLTAKGNYVPSIEVSNHEKLLMADVYDMTQEYLHSPRRAYRYGVPPEPLPPMRIRDRIAAERERLLGETKIYNKNAGYVTASLEVAIGHVDQKGNLLDKYYYDSFTIKELKKYISNQEGVSQDLLKDVEWKYRYFVEGEVNCADNLYQYINRDKNNDWCDAGWINAREFWSVDVLKSDI